MSFQLSDVIFLAGFLVYLGIRHVYARRTRNVERPVSRVGRLERFLILAVLVGSLLLPVVYQFTPLLSFADYSLPRYATWFGALSLVASIWLFWQSHADLAENWSVTLELRKDHKLITHGVYRWIRHPMYASIWLFNLAQVLLLANWLAGWAAIVAFAPMYFLRVPREEQMMREYFGQAYSDYMAATGRLLPRLART